MPDTSRFDWTEHFEALSLTFTQGLDDDAIISTLGLHRGDPEPKTFSEAWSGGGGDLDDDELDDGDDEFMSLVQLAHVADWTVVIEENGYQGSLPEHLTQLSARGQAVNVFWNVNSVMSFGYATAGNMVRFFDPVLFEIGEQIGEPLPGEADLDFVDDEADSTGQALLLAERLTGVTIERDWVMETARPILQGEI